MSANRRRFLLGSNALLVSLITIVILGLLYSIADDNRFQLDLSEDGVNTLKPDTLAKLQLLDADGETLKITAFTSQAGRNFSFVKNRNVRDLLKKIDRHSKVVEWEQIDFDRERLSAENLGVKEYGHIVLERGAARVDIRERSLFKRKGRGGGSGSLVFNGEEELSRAFSQLMSDKRRVVYFLRGHGEKSHADSSVSGLSKLAEKLSLDQYESRPLNLMKAPKGGVAPEIPDDAVVVAMILPTVPLVSSELDILLAYLGRGGSLFIATDVDAPPNELLERLGVTVPPGVAVDRETLFPFWDKPIPKVLNHEITRDLKENDLSVVLSHPAPLRFSEQKGIKSSPLLQLSRNGWIDRGGELSGSSAIFEEGIDVREQAVLLSALEVHPISSLVRSSKSTARIIVSGDYDWFSNDMFKGGNVTLATNLFHWLTAQDRRLQTQVNRKEELRQLTIPKPELGTIRFLTLVPMPALSFFIGLCVWWSRRGR